MVELLHYKIGVEININKIHIWFLVKVVNEWFGNESYCFIGRAGEKNVEILLSHSITFNPIL